MTTEQYRKRSGFSIFLSFFKPHRGLFFLDMACALVVSMIDLAYPIISRYAMRTLLPQSAYRTFFTIMLIVLAAYALRSVLYFIITYWGHTFGIRVEADIRAALFGHMQELGFEFFDRNRTGELMTRMSGDLDWCRHFMSYMSYAIVDCVCIFLSTLICFFFTSWRLTLFLVMVTPLLLLITNLYSRQARPLFVFMREKLSEMNAGAQENIAGNRVVKAFARESFEEEKFEKRSAAFRDSQLNINKKWLSFFPFIEILAHAMTIITVFLGGYLIIKGQLTPGQLTIFSQLTWALANPMRQLGNLINDFQRFQTSAHKVMELYCSRPAIQDRPTAKDHPSMKGKVEFQHVNAAFDRTEVLHDVSFTAEAGSTLAIMGPTGSGKTTLINLLARCYDVTGGTVLVDDTDVRDWKLQQLRGGLGVATQDVFLFSDTVDGNIAFGNQELTEDGVRECARIAAADDFIEGLSEKYDTIIGERGTGLSGGQKQRIALARALAMHPSILIMDDTTSALDSETEHYIQQQLLHLPFSCTKIIIGQRISAVKDADQILVLENGRITERGTHEELLKNHGYYWQTYALQNDLPMEGAAS